MVLRVLKLTGMDSLLGLYDGNLRFYIALLWPCRHNVFRNLSRLVTRLDGTRTILLPAMAQPVTIPV